jgi:hypothetical protein
MVASSFDLPGKQILVCIEYVVEIISERGASK